MRIPKGIAITGLLLLFSPAAAEETVTIVYQNDIHGWMFPSSNRLGMDYTARLLKEVFEKEPSSFYAVSGDLFAGPDLPDDMKGSAELGIWNRFREQLAEKGYGDRVLISAGNHEFDYGVPTPEAFQAACCAPTFWTKADGPISCPIALSKPARACGSGLWGCFSRAMPASPKLSGKKS